jgi:hypothetical protein
MMAYRHKKELWVAWFRTKEVLIFIEENLHNVTLQEEAMKLDMEVHKCEDYISKSTRIYTNLKWI